MNLGRLLERQAALHETKPFVTEAVGGRTLSYGDFNRLTNRIAHGLAAQGVAPGAYVAIMLTNSLAFLACSYALKKLGAIEVAINSAFRGPALARMVNLTGCATLVTADEHIEALADIADDLPALRNLVMVEAADAAARRLPDRTVRTLAEVMSDEESDFAPDMSDEETAVILFTSGTTGVSKGCPIPHRSSLRAAETMIEAFDITEADCVYTPYPMFHVGATQYDILPALMVGGRVVIRERFSLGAFWPDIVAHGVTWFMALGSVQQLLWSAPPCPEERQHKLRFVWSTPLPKDPDGFEKRFGLRLARGGGYGSTEAGSVALPLFDKAGAGRVLERYEVAIVDADDKALPSGELGELVIRAREPAIMASGYFANPEATAKSWRNGWFHTGDLAWLDADGDLHFVARMSERLRVKGEMVSAYEIEEVILGHEAIADCAVVGLPDGAGEEILKAFVTLREGAALEPQALRDYCVPRMSRFMVPAEVEILESMPRTPSGKPAKATLQARER